MMWTRTLAAAAVLASIAISAEAQSQSADERAIRDLIARYDRGESVASTDDTIYWTGPFKRPTVGSQEREPLPAAQQPSSARVPGAPSERVPDSRRRVTTPVRIEIATSGGSRLRIQQLRSQIRLEERRTRGGNPSIGVARLEERRGPVEDRGDVRTSALPGGCRSAIDTSLWLSPGAGRGWRAEIVCAAASADSIGGDELVDRMAKLPEAG